MLSGSPLDPAYATAPSLVGSAGGEPGWWRHPGGTVRIGHGGSGFTFDNEGPVHSVQLVPFELADRAVTCGQFLEFIADGGYRRPELWLSDGWATVVEQGWRAPMYWREEDGDEWSVFTLTGRHRVNPAEPVCHVSYYEGDAFARWAGHRLPTEFEWEAIAAEKPAPPGGSSTPRRRIRACKTRRRSSATCGPEPPPPTCHTRDSGKFMVNQHVLRGGACVTPHGHIRASYRNFFPPAARWPFTGLRLARDL